MMNYFSLIFSNNSVLRNLQIQAFKNVNLNGVCLEFGASHKLNRNFLKESSKKYKTFYSNIDKKNKKFLFLDLEKKINHKTKYDNIIIFNVLEHLRNINQPLNNIYFMLKKNGKIYGSTPFLYRIHGAPKDYNRYTKDLIKKELQKKNFKNIKIKELGMGPFLASFSLLRGYLKFLPIIYHILITLMILLDKILFFFMKQDPIIIYPIGYVFSGVKK